MHCAHDTRCTHTARHASGRLYHVNVKGVFHCLQAGVKKMLSDGRGGAIVNLASIASLIGLADRFAHAGSGSKRPALVARHTRSPHLGRPSYIARASTCSR